MSCPHLFDVAPYALGTLDPSERADVAAHLTSCRDCLAVLESIAGMPGLLARVGPDAVEPEELEPDEAMFERLVARTQPGAHPAYEPLQPDPPPSTTQPAAQPATQRGGQERRSGSRTGRPGRWRRWAAVVAAAAAVAVGTGTWLVETRGQDAGRVVAASSGDLHARAWLRPDGSGTAVRLELGGVTGEQRCNLVTVDRAGRRTVASTWEAGYAGTETFESMLALPIDQLSSLRVETERGSSLTLPVN